MCNCSVEGGGGGGGVLSMQPSPRSNATAKSPTRTRSTIPDPVAGRHRSVSSGNRGYSSPVQPQRFPLRPSSTMYWAIPLFGAAAVFFAFKLDTARGLNINGIFHLGVTGARIFFGVLGWGAGAGGGGGGGGGGGRRGGGRAGGRGGRRRGPARRRGGGRRPAGGRQRRRRRHR